MFGKALEYDSLKKVLLHMDANIRIQVSHRMPSLRNVEKFIPLKLNTLEIVDEMTTSLNGTRYRVGVYQHYPSGNVPRPVKNSNDRGGAHNDFDEFGFPVPSGRSVVLPGDISLRQDRENVERNDTDEKEMEYRQDLHVHESALRIKTELQSKGITVKEYLDTLEPIDWEDYDQQEERVRVALFSSADFLEYHIEKDKLRLLPFECRRTGTKPPFTCYIQLTIEKEKLIQIQRFEYSKKLFEAAKHLNQALFGGRTMPILVKHFRTVYFVDIYRLPVGFRVRANDMEVTDKGVDHENFMQMLEPSKCLNTLWLFFTMRDRDFVVNDVVQNSKTLRIVNRFPNIRGLIQRIGDLSHCKIYVHNFHRSYPSEEYFEFIQNWLSGGRPVGAECCIGIGSDEAGREVLNMIRTQNEKSKRTKRCVTVSFNDFTRLEVFYVPFDKSKSGFGGRHCNFLMKMRIVES